MKITLVSRDKKIPLLFSEIKKLKENEFSVCPPTDLKKVLKGKGRDHLFYIDISGFSAAERERTQKYLSGLENLHYGIIDPKGSIIDPAELFHNGACDYLGKDLLKKNIPAKRLKKLKEYGEMEAPLPAEEKKKDDGGMYCMIPSTDWSVVAEGNEYTFCFLFIELDGQKELKSHFGKEQLAEFTGSFRNFVGNQAARINGKIWMWMDFGGLILVPFDGKKTDIIPFCMELMVDRMLISIEQNFDRILSYRIALHVGNTEYKPRSETGTIVSDTINSIFHLGQKYSKPGSFVLTDRLFEFIPERMQECFVDDGIYEGRCIKRMMNISY